MLTVVLQASIWTLFTRLETRTKESNCCASVWDRNPRREMKVKVNFLHSLRCQGTFVSAASPGFVLCARSAEEHNC